MSQRYAAPFAAKQQTPFALPRFRGHLAATRPLWCSQARTAAAFAGLQPRCLPALQCNTVAQPHSRTAPQPRIRAEAHPPSRKHATPHSPKPQRTPTLPRGQRRRYVARFFSRLLFLSRALGLPASRAGSRRTPPTRIREGGSPFVVYLGGYCGYSSWLSC